MADSMNFIRSFWAFLGRPSLSLWLIYLLFADILAGSVIMKQHREIFFALETRMLQEWLATYGLKNIQVAWWFFASLFLLFFLALTTLVCTTNKTIAIIRRFYGSGIWGLLLKLSPSIIHIGFVLLLLGQLASHTLGVNSHGNILGIGRQMTVRGSGITVVLKDLKITFFNRNTSFLGMEGNAKTVSGTLLLRDPHGVHEKEISMNHPVMHEGWSFFIEDFSPKSEDVKRPPYINMTVRRDPGISLMIAGAIVFGLGLMLYLISAIQSRIGRGHVSCGVSEKYCDRPQKMNTKQGRTKISQVWMPPVLFILLFAGCSMDFEQFGQFTVKSLHDGRKEITDGIGRKLLLVPRGNKPLKGDEEARTVRVPVEKVVVYSAYNAALIKELGRVNSIAGVISPEERWYIPEIREGIRDGKISYIGEYKSIDYEKLKALKPNVVFTWDEGIIPKLEELSIPCVLTSTRIAKDLASHINFIQFLSAFYGEEEMAKSFVDAQFKEIDEISAGWKEAKSKPKVVWGDIYERKVLVEPGNSWAGQMVERRAATICSMTLKAQAVCRLPWRNFFQEQRAPISWSHIAGRKAALHRRKGFASQADCFRRWKSTP